MYYVAILCVKIKSMFDFEFMLLDDKLYPITDRKSTICAVKWKQTNHYHNKTVHNYICI